MNQFNYSLCVFFQLKNRDACIDLEDITNVSKIELVFKKKNNASSITISNLRMQACAAN